jgi:acylphosphatase
LDARARITISGTVQGVFFRREIVDLARRLGLTGWSRNLPDGRVEILAEGEKEKIIELIKFCHIGPPLARVKNVEVQWSNYEGELRNFRISR